MIPFNEKLRTQQEVAALTQPPRPNMFAPGNTQGATVDQTVQGKQAANSQAAGYGANQQVQPQAQPAAQQTTQTPQSTPQNNQSTQSHTPAYTGGSNNPNAGADYLASLLTTPAREEELRKQSVQRQRIMAVGDALRHIGNLYFATQGAPSQKFNNPAEEERKRYLQEKALRDANNYKYMTYQQAKAAQEAKIAQAERQFQYNAALNTAKMQAQQKQWDAQNKENARYHDLTHGLNVKKQEATEKRWERQDSESERTHRANEALRRQSNGIAAANLSLNKEKFEHQKNNGGGGSTGSGSGRGAGYTYATKNGSVTIPADYLKSNVNKQTILTAMERSGAVDKAWLDQYDLNQWNKDAQEKMLDKAVSNWLMNDDQAEVFMEKHLRGKRSGETSTVGTMPGVGAGSSNTMPGVK